MAGQEHRDLDDDGLLWIVAPDESGQDASNQFDAIWGRQAHGLPGYLRLIHRNRRLGFDLRRVVAAGGPVCCEVVTNVLYNLARLALGRPSLTPALIERSYDARRGLFVPRARPAPRRTPAVDIAALAPLALPDLPEEIGHRLVEEHLLNPERFWTPVPPPSVSVDEPSFSVNDRGLLRQRRYWRGPTWMNTAWLCWLGLVRLGYDEPAAQLAQRLGVCGGGGGAARVLRPRTPGPAWGRRTSGGRAWCWSCSSPTSRPPATSCLGAMPRAV